MRAGVRNDALDVFETEGTVAAGSAEVLVIDLSRDELLSMVGASATLVGSVSFSGGMVTVGTEDLLTVGAEWRFNLVSEGR